MIVCMDDKVTQLLAELGAYLAMPSLDGRPDRQVKRQTLAALRDEILQAAALAETQKTTALKNWP